MQVWPRYLMLVLLLWLPTTVLADLSPYTLAVHPYLPAEEIHKRFSPLADYLADQLGRPVEIRVGGNYEEHINAIGNDRVELAFLGPAAYVEVVEQFGEKPILGRFIVNDQALLYGVIAIPEQSPIKELKQLKQVRFAFGDPHSTMSHIVPRYMLMQAGIEKGLPDRHQYLGSHKNVAYGILAGDYDAGAMKQEVFDSFKARGLRALATTPGVPDHLFVASNSLPPEQVERLRQALLSLHEQPGGKRILASLHKQLTRLSPARSEDYRQLGKMIKAVQ